MKTTLVIMAAGLGTRYGEGRIKQLDPIGPNNEIIMDYSIYDAKAAGFEKVVFIIRRDIKQAFDDMIGSRIGRQIETDYVYQQTEDVPAEFKHLERVKPWGTGHAVLACKGVVNEPFAVINADDVYGRQAFVSMHDFLVKGSADNGRLHLAMPGFILGNTLSREGSVTRGVCTADENDMLTDITETYGIRDEDGRVIALTAKGAETTKEISRDSHVSMNMWACPAEFIGRLDDEFVKFLEKSGTDAGSEFLLPTVINDMLHRGEADCRMIETQDKWFGMTSARDRIAAQEAVRENIAAGVYPERLWKD
ncbi:MAG: nucleotidyltransferase [Ruminococcus sp.]|nr:nucleotidyltransferase [Ruminococcus sp.]